MIATIRTLPYNLATFPENYLTMSFLAIDIPPHYRMLLSRKWSASMGGSLQCDLSYATFFFDCKNVKIERKSRVPYMMVHEQDFDEDVTCFIDIDINAFKIEYSPR